jgi:hypothetical protein
MAARTAITIEIFFTDPPYGDLPPEWASSSTRAVSLWKRLKEPGERKEAIDWFDT